MNKSLLLLFLLSTPFAFAEVVFHDNFETIKPKAGQPIHTMTANDAKIGVVNNIAEPSASGAVAGSKSALMIQGGEEEKHSWQPAGDIAIPFGKHGFLYVGFRIKNASFEPSLFGIQISQKGDSHYQMWQRLRLYPDRFNISGTGRGLARDQISAGANAEWMHVEWILPMPQLEIPATPVLRINGIDQGEFKMEPMTTDLDAINNLRLWLPTLRGEDTKFFIDDLLVITGPTVEDVMRQIEAAQK